MGDPTSHAPEGERGSGASGPGDEDPTTPARGLLGGRAVAAFAAIAVGLVAAVVIVSVGDDDEGAGDPGDAVGINAVEQTSGDGSGEPGGTTASLRDYEVDLEGPVDIAVRESDEGLVEITVTDPATPVVEGAEVRQCVTVTLAGPAVVEAYACSPVGSGTDVEPVAAQLSSPGDPVIGCAATVSATAAGASSTLDATSRFVVVPGAALPPGGYDVEVSATSGSGDGCAPADEPAEHASLGSFELVVD